MTTLGAHDSSANLCDNRGNTFRQKNGLIEVPDTPEGSKLVEATLKGCPMFYSYKKAYAGFDKDEMKRRYDEWAAKQSEMRQNG